MSIGDALVDFAGGAGVGLGQAAWLQLKEQSDLRKAEAISQLRRQEDTLSQDRQDARQLRADDRADARAGVRAKHELDLAGRREGAAMRELRARQAHENELFRREAEESQKARDQETDWGVTESGEPVRYRTNQPGQLRTPREDWGSFVDRLRAEGGGQLPESSELRRGGGELIGPSTGGRNMSTNMRKYLELQEVMPEVPDEIRKAIAYNTIREVTDMVGNTVLVNTATQKVVGTLVEGENGMQFVPAGEDAPVPTQAPAGGGGSELDMFFSN